MELKTVYKNGRLHKHCPSYVFGEGCTAETCHNGKLCGCTIRGIRRLSDLTIVTDPKEIRRVLRKEKKVAQIIDARKKAKLKAKHRQRRREKTEKGMRRIRVAKKLRNEFTMYDNYLRIQFKKHKYRKEE